VTLEYNNSYKENGAFFVMVEGVNDLTPEEILRLKNSICRLESTIISVYSTRRARDLLGEEGILVRTLGANWGGPSHFESHYFDERRNAIVNTEFAEVLEALDIYDENPSRESEIELLLEVGDVLFQREITRLKHGDNESCGDVMGQIDSALDYIRRELEKRGLSFDKVEKFAEIKYGSRAWLGANGYKAKDKDLERKLCFEAYDS
jgi:hypothetical protein